MAHRYQIGDVVPFRFLPGIVVASYFTSLLGAITTVELLHRRKTGKGVVGLLHLGACSVSFGLAAIWCMHYVGNRAIILADGDPVLQLYYNPAWTALSAFLPVVFLFLGFIVTDMNSKYENLFVKYTLLNVVGIATGAAITGMHYVGNLGIDNYQLRFDPGYIAGASIIAVGSAMVSFTLFFILKERWINKIWRRLACAAVLAASVTGMHFTASIGTVYELQLLIPKQSERNVNLGVAIALSILACIVCLGIAILHQRRQRKLLDRAQHVVLACATFDEDGRIMVTHEGSLPCQKVTRQYNQRSFTDEFNVSHPVFHWLFKVTRNWGGITEMIPPMRSHLGTMSAKAGGGASSRASESTGGDESEFEDYSVVFRERFCVAAADLAERMGVNVSDLGVLYEEIIMTGTLTAQSLMLQRQKRKNLARDLEAGGPVIPALFGKGQTLFLVRHADSQEALKFIGKGFSFAQVEVIGEHLGREFQVSRQDLLETLRCLREYSRREEGMPATGTYLASFCLKPSYKSFTSGWEVLVPRANTSQLPMVRLSPEPLSALQTAVVTSLSGYSVERCLQQLNQKMSASKQEE
ncbi:hypothetical protein BDY21DRAFT_274810, partial [Lineolata rhizophorae]